MFNFTGFPFGPGAENSQIRRQSLLREILTSRLSIGAWSINFCSLELFVFFRKSES